MTATTKGPPINEAMLKGMMEQYAANREKRQAGKLGPDGKPLNEPTGTQRIIHSLNPAPAVARVEVDDDLNEWYRWALGITDPDLSLMAQSMILQVQTNRYLNDVLNVLGQAGATLVKLAQAQGVQPP